jgi:hypothetical protein
MIRDTMKLSDELGNQISGALKRAHTEKAILFRSLARKIASRGTQLV